MYAKRQIQVLLQHLLVFWRRHSSNLHEKVLFTRIQSRWNAQAFPDAGENETLTGTVHAALTEKQVQRFVPSKKASGKLPRISSSVNINSIIPLSYAVINLKLMNPDSAYQYPSTYQEMYCASQ